MMGISRIWGGQCWSFWGTIPAVRNQHPASEVSEANEGMLDQKAEILTHLATESCYYIIQDIIYPISNNLNK